MCYLRIVLLFLFLPILANAQVSCPAGSAITGEVVNTGATCTPFMGSQGSDIVKTNQTTALGAQVICDTSSTCPAGVMVLYVYIVPTTTGTLLSSVTPTITYTDPLRTYTNQALNSSSGNPALSLLTIAPGSYIFFFYHTANTTVSVATNVTTLTGSPSYNLYTRLLW